MATASSRRKHLVYQKLPAPNPLLEKREKDVRDKVSKEKIKREKHLALLDDEERKAVHERILAEKRKGKVLETRFKGLGEMNPLQLRESTVDPDTRRLVQLTVESHAATTKVMDMLLGKKRASDRKAWLEDKGNLATI